MKLARLRAIGIVAGVAAFAFIGTPVSAGAAGGVDGDGVDFDAACVIGTGLENGSIPEADNIESDPMNANAGGSLGVPANGDGCEVISTYDGTTESTDLTSYTLESVPDTTVPSDVLLSATWLLSFPLPPAGGTCNPQANTNNANPPGCPDLPNNTFVGFGYKMLFQNPAYQNNLPTNHLGGGCLRVNPPGGHVFDQHGHWLDGYHHFIGFDVVWDGARWVYSAQVGTYDPSPDGAFFFTELGTDDGVDDDFDGSTWDHSDPAAKKGIHWDVTFGPGFQVLVSVDGVLPSSNSLCDGGVFNTVYARANDLIANIKALTTADSTVTLPVTILLSKVPQLGLSDITSVGGFIFFSDITLGNSRNVGTGGLLAGLSGDDPTTACVHEGFYGNRLCVSYTPGQFGSDTLGDSPACPTPTFGGTLPSNPLKNPNFGCQYDDDNLPQPGPTPGGPWIATNPGERGTFLPEWWDTVHKFIA